MIIETMIVHVSNDVKSLCTKYDNLNLKECQPLSYYQNLAVKADEVQVSLNYLKTEIQKQINEGL